MSQKSRKSPEQADAVKESNEESPRHSGETPARLPAPALPESLLKTQLSVASYIEEMSAELAIMARAARLHGLAHFVEMTRLEAEITRHGCEARRAASKRAGS